MVMANPVRLASSLASSRKGIMWPWAMKGSITTWCLASVVVIVLKFSAGKRKRVGESIAGKRFR